MINFWNDRYKNKEFAYGVKPNVFMAEQILKLSPGKILFPAEGEGRNAVFAATQGWEVTAFDPSEEGRKKALKLATQQNINIIYELHDFASFAADLESFDCICLVYAHMPDSIRCKIHQKLSKYLKPGGILLLEAFSKNQLNKKSGGPNNRSVLYSTEELKTDFKGFSQLNIEEKDIQLEEGIYHKGTASVVRVIGVK